MRAALLIIACVSTALLGAGTAFADGVKETVAGTAAGRVIPNTASVEYEVAGERHSIESNNATVQVAELVAFKLTLVEEGKTGVKGGEEEIFEFDVTSAGNGTECFATTVTGNTLGGLDIVPVSLTADTNNNGVYDAGDTDVAFGACDVWLAPGQTMRLFLKARMPAGVEVSKAYVSIVVAPSQGLGDVGKVFVQKGDGFSDALSGTDPDDSQATFRAQGSNLNVALNKTTAVAGNASRTMAAPGETIVYSLALKGEGEGSITNAVVSDPLPATLSYIPGSMKLDGVALSDAGDSDAGSFEAGAVSVRIGDRAAPFNTVITFEALVVATPAP